MSQATTTVRGSCGLMVGINCAPPPPGPMICHLAAAGETRRLELVFSTVKQQKAQNSKLNATSSSLRAFIFNFIHLFSISDHRDESIESSANHRDWRAARRPNAQAFASHLWSRSRP